MGSAYLMNTLDNASSGKSRLGTYALTFPLFFASGAAGLIYEIVWTRKLIYVFGSGLYAVTAVLSAFMAGLALGSYLMGKRADGVRFPLRLYAMLETLIAVAGFFMPMALAQMDRVDAWAYGRWAENFAALTTCRFVAAFLLLLIPTTLMGATLPILAKGMVRHGGRLGLRVGALYAVNTAGAVAGAFYAGFHAIGVYGVIQTNHLAAILNTFAAIGAYALSGFVEAFPGEEDSLVGRDSSPDVGSGEPTYTTDITDAGTSLILFASFATGIVSMAAQVIWTRSLVFCFEFLKNTTYAFSAMLTIFLSGLALGGAIAGLFADRATRPARLYGIILAALGFSILVSVATLHSGAGENFLVSPFNPATQEFRWITAVGNIMGQTAWVLALPTLLMGMAFPISARAIARATNVAGEVGRLYALNTAGCIVGPLAACFILIPLLGLAKGLTFIALSEMALGLFLAVRFSESRGRAASIAVGVVIVALLQIGVIPWSRGIERLNPGEIAVYHDEGPMATVTVSQNTFGYRTIVIDGVGVAGTDPMLQTDQKSLAHLPMLLVENPRAALTVGFGSGGASYSYLLHDRLEKVHCAEICPQVPRAAPYLTDANHGFLAQNDPRYKIIMDDARGYLGHTDQNYDIIATDCTDLRYKSNANLYDVEYFEYCRERLNPGGVVVVWMPLGGLSLDIFKLALRTLHLVFPEMAVFYMTNEPTHYILLVGWRDKMELDPRRIVERLAESDVKADLDELQLGDTMKILSTWIVGGRPLEAYLKGDRYNTENFPYIEFESPKYGYGDRPILDNLASLVAIRNSPREFFVPGSASDVLLAALDRYEQAMPKIIEGHAAYRNLDMEGAAKGYLAAQALTPEDKSVANLLTFRELAHGIALQNPWSFLMMGRALHLQGRKDEAKKQYERAAEILSSQPQLSPIQRTWLDNSFNWRRDLEQGK